MIEGSASIVAGDYRPLSARSPAATGKDAILPNFFLVGAPKAGTTALYGYLDRHPQVYMSPIKEPCYFASEIRPENFGSELQPRARREQQVLREYFAAPVLAKRFGGIVTKWDDYLKLFAGVRGETAIGEASVCYLWSSTAAANIAARIPEAKILMVLRDPAERAFSQYLHAVTEGIVRGSFHDQIRKSLERRDDLFAPLYPFLDLGLYYTQVKRYLALFPRDQIKICFYEDYREKPQEMLAGIFEFLAVDPNPPAGGPIQAMEPRIPVSVSAGYFLKRSGLWRQVRRMTPEFVLPAVRRLIFQHRAALAMDPSDRKFLVDYYREDILNLSSLLERDLAAWLA
jgi:hypothetical protein